MFVDKDGNNKDQVTDSDLESAVAALGMAAQWFISVVPPGESVGGDQVAERLLDMAKEFVFWPRDDNGDPLSLTAVTKRAEERELAAREASAYADMDHDEVLDVESLDVTNSIIDDVFGPGASDNITKH